MKRKEPVDINTRYREFVLAWQSSKTLGEVCEKLGLERRRASLKASLLRQRGIELKKFATTRNPLNMEELKTLANEYNRQEQQNDPAQTGLS